MITVWCFWLKTRHHINNHFIYCFCHFLFLISPPFFGLFWGTPPFIFHFWLLPPSCLLFCWSTPLFFYFWRSYSIFPLCIYFYYVFISYFHWTFLIFDGRQYFFTFSGRWFYFLTTRYFGTREFFSIFYYFVSRPFHERILLPAVILKLYLC